MKKIIASFLGLLLLLMCQQVKGQEEPGDIKIQEYDHVYIKNATQPLIGTIVRRTETQIFIRLRDYNTDIDTPISIELIEKIEPRTTIQQAYQIKRSRVAPGDFMSCYEVAQWASRYPELQDKTRDTLRDCIKMNSAYLDAYFLLSDLLIETQRNSENITEKELNEEIELYHHAIRSGVEDARIYYRLGVAVRGAGLPEMAIKEFEKAKELAEKTGFPSIALWSALETAEILVELGHAGEALELFDRILSENTDNYRALVGKGEALLLLNRLDEAGIALTSAINADQLYPKPYFLLGCVAYYKGELLDAETWLNTATDVALKDASVLTALGLVHARTGKFISAENELAEAAALNPDDPAPEIAMGYLAENKGNTDDAITAYQRAILKKGNDGLALFKLASAHFSKGEYDLARVEFNRALEEGYRPVEIFKYLGRIAYENGDYGIASRYLQYAVKSDDSDAQSHYLLAMSCLKLDMESLARRYFQKAVENNPAHSDALNGLGYIAYSSGAYDEATAYFSSSLNANPGNPYAQEGITKIGRILNWAVWEDDFDREESDNVSNGWEEEEKYGIEIRIEDNRIKFRGKQRQTGKETSIQRTENGRQFARIETQIDGSGVGNATYGIKIEKRTSKDELQGGIYIAKDSSGLLSCNYTEERGKWKSEEGPIPIEPFPLDSRAHTFGLGLIERATGTFEIYFDGRSLMRVTCGPLANASELLVAIFVKTQEGDSIELVINKVRIYRNKKD